MKNLLRNLILKHLTIDGASYVIAAGTSDVNSEAVYCQNVEETTFLLTLGVMAASATVDMKIQGSLDGSTSWTDLEGTALTQAVAADDDKMLAITVRQCSAFGYLRVAITRGDGGNATLEALHCFQTGLRKVPFTQAVTAGQFVAAPEFSLSPAAGTA